MDTSGKFLAGVEFSLIHAETGAVAQTATSNAKGEFVFTKVAYGDWIVRETRVPAGFCQMEDVTLHIDENWVQTEPIRCVNIPNHYEFIKVDNHGKPLTGVKFTLTDASGIARRQMISGADGIVHVVDLTPGVYIIREIETLEGYTRTNETIKIVIDEHYVVPTQMLRLVNYEGIQTGVDLTLTPTMWLGIGLMLSGVGVAVAYGCKRCKKKRKTKHR